MIRVLIAEDQALLRGALAALLSLEPDLAVVGEAEDGERALALARELRPDVLLTDIEMPRLSGLDLAARLQGELPGIRTVIVTTFGRAGYLRRALEVGARGYLLKDAPASELADAIRRVRAGGRWTRSWPPRPGANPTPSPSVSARCCGWPRWAARAPQSLPSWASARARSGITSRRRSPSWGRPTGWRRRASRRKRAGCSAS